MKIKLEEKGWTGAQLSIRTGIETKSIYKYLEGKVENPRGNTLQKIAEALGTTEQWLRYGLNNSDKQIESSKVRELLGSKLLDIVYVPIVDNQELLQLVLNTLTVEQLMDKSNKIAIAPKDDFSKDLVAIEVIDEANFPELKLKDVLTIDLNRKPTHGKLTVAVIEGYEHYVIGTLQREMREGKPTDILHFSNNSFPKIFLADANVLDLLSVVIHAHYV